MQTTPEILDPHSGSFAIDIDIALKIVNVVVTVTGAGLNTGSSESIISRLAVTYRSSCARF